MKDVNIEYGSHCFSGAAVVKHSKEVFIEANKSRTFFGVSDEETAAILSEVYDKAVIAIERANKAPEKQIPVQEPVIVQETLNDNTEGKERGVEGTSANKKPAKNKKQ